MPQYGPSIGGDTEALQTWFRPRSGGRLACSVMSAAVTGFVANFLVLGIPARARLTRPPAHIGPGFWAGGVPRFSKVRPGWGGVRQEHPIWQFSIRPDVPEY